MPFTGIASNKDILSKVVMVICIPETVPSSFSNKVELAMQEGGTVSPSYDTKRGVGAAELNMCCDVCCTNALRSYCATSGPASRRGAQGVGD